MGDRLGVWNTKYWPTYNAADSRRTFSWILPYLVLPCTTFHYEKLTTVELVSKFPASHETQRFISVFTTICHKILFWRRWNRYTSPNLISVTLLLILLPHLHHILLYGSTELFYTVLSLPCMLHAPTHSILQDVTNIIMIYGEWKMEFLLPPVISSPCCPNIHFTNCFKMPTNSFN
jgi:hypothetical protein